jgi:hypothetical protein
MFELDVGRGMMRRMLEEVDFSSVLRTAVNDCGVPSPAHALDSLDAFLQWFSTIPLAGDRPYVMLKGNPDRVWHACIINTALYRELCERYLGRFVDHHPSVASPSDEWVLETVALLEEEFGADLHPAFRQWRAHGLASPS